MPGTILELGMQNLSKIFQNCCKISALKICQKIFRKFWTKNCSNKNLSNKFCQISVKKSSKKSVNKIFSKIHPKASQSKVIASKLIWSQLKIQLRYVTFFNKFEVWIFELNWSNILYRKQDVHVHCSICPRIVLRNRFN